MPKKAKLLFITQKIHDKDDDLAFVILWVKEFVKQDFDVSVICLEKRDFDDTFSVSSLGKELGYGKFRQALNFLRLIFTLDYERVFVHMNPEYFTLGGWWWFLTGKSMYFWYTHYTMTFHVWLAGKLCKRMFAATAQSLPQYEGSPKKVITGHGIDLGFWQKAPAVGILRRPAHDLVSIHRICRSKRLEIGIQALKFLPAEYNLTIYGRDVEKDYYRELLEMVKKEGLVERVRFMGPLPMPRLKEIYRHFA